MAEAYLISGKLMENIYLTPLVQAGGEFPSAKRNYLRNKLGVFLSKLSDF